MGGGGAMRAAAKIAGIRAVNGGLRGVPAEHTAAREATRPVSAIVSSSDELKSSVLKASQNNAIDAAGVQRPCWELDDWEFAGVEEEVIVKSAEPMPRLVFGGVPTLQEAKEATSELKNVLEKAYLTLPHSTESGDLLVPGHQYPFSLVPNSDYSETKACVTSETAGVPVPNNAIKAFRLLNESPAAQNVVASIASDPNVWHAVLQNEALTEFLESQKSTASFSDVDSVVKESLGDVELTDKDAPKSADEFGDPGKSADSGNGFMGFMHTMKTKVDHMMSSLSDYFQSLFGGPTEEKDSSDADAKSTFGDKAMGASFMGLAVMVIMMVVLKRV